jgi:putative peptidoglycan lipid II flippase
MPRSSRKSGFLRAFFVSVLGTGLSRVFGALRDGVIAGVLGATSSSDAFLIAYTIPSVFRRFVADEGLTGALIPGLADAERKDGTGEAKIVANAVFGGLILANIVLCSLGILFAKPLVLAFAWAYGNDPEQLELAVTLTRVLFPFVTMVSFVSYFEGILNYKRHFFVPKIAPGLVSAGVVVCALLFADSFSDPTFAVAVGFLVGGVIHVLVNLPWVWQLWGPVQASFAFGNRRVRHLAGEMGKVILIGVFAQINVLVLRQYAIWAGEGALTHYWNATRLIDLAQGMIAVGIGSALLPNITGSVADKNWDQFREDLTGAIRLAGFLLIPAAAVVYAFPVPLASLIYRHGNYSMADVHHTADTVTMMVPFLLALAGLNILKKAFFALDDRRTLLIVGGFGVALTAALGTVFVDRYGIPGLGLALSVATTAQLGCYLLVLRNRMGEHLGLLALVSPLLRMSIAAVPVVGVLLMATSLGAWEEGPASVLNVLVVIIALAVAGVCYGGAAWVLRIEELRALVRRLQARVQRST